MTGDVSTAFLGFLEGFSLILSPCILSVLPLVFAGAWVGSKRRSFGIVLGFVVVFVVVAFTARQWVQYTGVDIQRIRSVAYVLLLLFSFTLVLNPLYERFNGFLQRILARTHVTNISLPLTYGFWGGVGLGGVLAMLWTPCVGPIVAAVIVQIAIQKTNEMSLLTLLMFALGAATPMLILILYGFKIKESFGFFKTHALLIRQGLGGIILLNLAYMISLEMGFLSSQALVTDHANIRTANYLEQGVWRPYPAPEISGITTWINSPPLNLADLKGHVVLVDFWTYSCINCIRTVPYLNRWYEKYHQQGLILIGVHSPEFEFEKNVHNVTQAVQRLGIHYPVALDNAFVTWRNFSNHYWPAHYLIDKNGKIVYEHFGEGDEVVTEHNLQFLLGLGDLELKKKTKEGSANLLITPEIYLGSARSKADTAPHFNEGWAIQPDKIVSVQSHAALSLSFDARRVFMVMGPGTKKSRRVTLRFNGKPLLVHAGKDVVQGKILVDHHGLYEAVVLPGTTSGTLDVISDEPGLEIYTFTFGR